ncbi:acyltransferase family protein [Heliobacterium gestii]|uniref:Acyltransferase family protein n=1 Tax=Heliomicrobium gestii TaxID=2699 RepID=A0A845LHT4_HELGE|nr:acyltransferase family protein [Heliomicrobium gestii]MBM7867466.1 peptidoglycan/LPS O-acetylase OafA/YrhL [Heliomicrobium gestii]MZP43985.1 acyltransferase family protein [Heliomicrobium gestii]
MQNSSERLYFIDNLRVFTIFLVIVLHASLCYMVYAPQWWYVVDPQRSFVFDINVLLIDIFIMPTMFFAAGYFATPTLRKKGTGAFWIDKGWRILLPWVLGSLCLAPLIAYMIIFSRTDTPPNYIGFWFGDFWGPYFQQAHYWFLGVLTLFFLAFTLVNGLIPRVFQKEARATQPSRWLFPAFLIITTGAFLAGNLFYSADAWEHISYLFVIQPARIGIYAAYFALGIYSWRCGWFTAFGYRPRPLGWSLAAVITAIAYLAYRIAHPAPTELIVKLGWGLLQNAFSMTTFFALLALFQRYVNQGGYWWRRFGENSYGIYYIHNLILLPTVYLLRPTGLPVLLKFVIVVLFTMLFAFVFLEYIVKVPLRWRKGTIKSPGYPSNQKSD